MKNIPIYLVLIFSLSSCWHPTYKAFKELKNTEFNNQPELSTARKAIRFIESGELDSLKKMFPFEIIEVTKESDWIDVMNKGSEAVNLSAMPPDSLVEISNTLNLDKGVRQIFAKLSFPYGLQENDQATKYINIITSEGQLYGLNVADHPFGMRFVEPEHSEPHLGNHSLNYDSINWFRLWYGSGYQRNEYGGSYGYYAVSGDKKKIDELQIEKELSELFQLINEAKIDSTDFKYLRDDNKGSPEYIYMRFKFDNEPYSDFGEFTIDYYLSEEPGITESLSSYIILKHSGKTRYLIDKKGNQRIVEILRDITYRNYRKHDEPKWR